MRLALTSTAVAAVLAAPMVVEVTSPRMSDAEFLSAVECVAYRSALASNSDLAAMRWHLNVEASKQPSEIVALARQQARLISAKALTGAEVPVCRDGSQIADAGFGRGLV